MMDSTKFYPKTHKFHSNLTHRGADCEAQLLSTNNEMEDDQLFPKIKANYNYVIQSANNNKDKQQRSKQIRIPAEEDATRSDPKLVLSPSDDPSGRCFSTGAGPSSTILLDGQSEKYCDEDGSRAIETTHGGVVDGTRDKDEVGDVAENTRNSRNAPSAGVGGGNGNSGSGRTEKKKTRCCGSVTLLILGLCNLALAVLTIRFPIFKQLMRERLRMTPGLPAFDLWYNPPTSAKFNVFIFNITNADRVLSGKDEKLNVQELGPLVFREILIHKDVVFHEENSTMSFTATRSAEFLPDENIPGILDKEILVPNLLSLGLASYMHDASAFTKFGMKLLLSGEPAFIKLSVSEYLWNVSSPVMKMGRSFVPFLIPMDNAGIINIIYNDFTDRTNVNIGTMHGNEQFFLVNTYEGGDRVPGFDRGKERLCDASVVNATEGVVYPQFLAEDTVLRYWRKTHCKVLPLYFEEKAKVGLINTNKYILKNDSYDRANDTVRDCHAGDPRMPSGLIDVSRCVFGFPIAASFPHFFAGDKPETQKLRDQVTGLKPNDTRHRSFIKAEPTTGVPVSQCARSQSNLVVRKLSGFGRDIDKMSDTVIPMFWAEYCLPQLPTYMTVLIILVSQVMPVMEVLLPVLFTFCCVLCLSVVLRRQVDKNSAATATASLTARLLQRFTNRGAAAASRSPKSPKTNYTNFIRVNTGLYFDKKAMTLRADRK